MNDAKTALSHFRSAVELGDSCIRRTGYGHTLFVLGVFTLAEFDHCKALEMKPAGSSKPLPPPRIRAHFILWGCTVSDD